MNSDSLFSERLKLERKRLKLSQAEAGIAAGVSREMWGKYERGAMPGGDVLIALKNAGFDIPTILAGANRLDVSISLREIALLSNFRSSHPDVQLGVEALLAATVKK